MANDGEVLLMRGGQGRGEAVGGTGRGKKEAGREWVVDGGGGRGTKGRLGEGAKEACREEGEGKVLEEKGRNVLGRG